MDRRRTSTAQTALDFGVLAATCAARAQFAPTADSKERWQQAAEDIVRLAGSALLLPPQRILSGDDSLLLEWMEAYSRADKKLLDAQLRDEFGLEDQRPSTYRLSDSDIDRFVESMAANLPVAMATGNSLALDVKEQSELARDAINQTVLMLLKSGMQISDPRLGPYLAFAPMAARPSYLELNAPDVRFLALRARAEYRAAELFAMGEVWVRNPAALTTAQTQGTTLAMMLTFTYPISFARGDVLESTVQNVTNGRVRLGYVAKGPSLGNPEGGIEEATLFIDINPSTGQRDLVLRLFQEDFVSHISCCITVSSLFEGLRSVSEPVRLIWNELSCKNREPVIGPGGRSSRLIQRRVA